MNESHANMIPFQIRNADLLNIEFKVVPLESGNINYFSGHLIRGAFLAMLAEQNERLVTELHDGKAVKPYSIAPVALRFKGDKREKLYRVVPGKPLYFRLSSLSRDVSMMLMRTALTSQDRIVKIGETNCIVDGIRFSTQDYAGLARADSISSRYKFIFLSPTLFEIRSETFPMLFPLPSYVFGSLASLWNRFAPEELHLDMDRTMEQLKSVVVATQHNIHTTQVRIKGHIPISGYVGTVMYKIAREASSEARRIFTLLSRWAPFSGVGAKRSFGFGAVDTIEK